VLFNKPIPCANVKLDSKWQQQHAYSTATATATEKADAGK
jgi:hypothetical protein